MSDRVERFLQEHRNETAVALTSERLWPVFMPPDRVGLPSSWWGHVPFAHWLMSEIKPGIVVELGTHHGVSFSAFCKTAKTAGLESRCFAIDSWQGDEHAGFYDESVFSNISASVKQNYVAFATLIRSTFDEALALFADGSIDLLHIDGLHTYEAVKADYEAWLPKLSKRAVVLFHDTVIYERGFGVWRLWEEISRQHPSFEFRHSCGLGVVCPGGEVPEFVASLIEMEPAAASALRQRLADLGERWITVDEIARATVTSDTLNRALIATNEAMSASNEAALHAKQHAMAADAAALNATRAATELRAENASLQQDTRTHGLAAETASSDLAEARARMSELLQTSARQHSQLVEAEAERDALRQQLTAVVQHAERLGLHLEEIRTSTSWRVMGPYRIAGRLMKHRVIAPLQKSQQVRDFRRISRASAFNAAFYLGRESAANDRDGVIRDYQAASQMNVPRGQPKPGKPPRRPALGFHPLAYAAQCSQFDEASGEDPLAHYLRTGQPDGPWKHAVIEAYRPARTSGTRLSILVHAHFHYPELLDDMLDRLKINDSPRDLFITTTSEAKAEIIRSTLATRREVATVAVVGNRGRNISSLLMHLPEFEKYDIVGHVHGKRSPQQLPAHANNWREFLWDHLIGGQFAMVDVIAEAFAADQRLGLVFPEDPNLNHWDMNYDLAQALAKRLGLCHPLPAHFEFPKGSMFWARPAALRPLFDLGWEWDDFPAEPVKSDGTTLHTIERLIPFSAARAELGVRSVHVPHSWRLPED